MSYRFLLLIILGTILTSCSSSSKLNGSEKKEISRLISSSPFSDHFTGIAIWDIRAGKWVYRSNEDKLFTPASNVKILTLLATQHFLGDSLPLFQYHVKDATLHIQGNGNPAFLHPDFSAFQENWNTKLIDEGIEKVVLHIRAMENDRYGPGWSWDDYTYYFQKEISSFPVYGNSLWIEWDRKQQMLHLSPDYIAQFADVELESQRDHISVNREEYANQFVVKAGATMPQGERYSAPFLIDPYIQSQLLGDTLKLPVSYSFDQPNFPWKNFNPVPLDTLLRKMMYDSDNFIAEQLLLASSSKQDSLSTKWAIKQYMKYNLPEYENEISWVDGSGLSRYNLLSPIFLVHLLNKSSEKWGPGRLSYFFPEIRLSDGKGKTMERHAVIFAKTGQLKNHLALSGFISTKDDRLLSFSIMNDNFVEDPKQVKKGMLHLLQMLIKNY